MLSGRPVGNIIGNPLSLSLMPGICVGPRPKSPLAGNRKVNAKYMFTVVLIVCPSWTRSQQNPAAPKTECPSESARCRCGCVSSCSLHIQSTHTHIHWNTQFNVRLVGSTDGKLLALHLSRMRISFVHATRNGCQRLRLLADLISVGTNCQASAEYIKSFQS